MGKTIIKASSTFPTIGAMIETDDSNRTFLQLRDFQLDGSSSGAARADIGMRLGKVDTYTAKDVEIRGVKLYWFKNYGIKFEGGINYRNDRVRILDSVVEKTDLNASIDKVQQKIETREQVYLGFQKSLQEEEASLRQAEEEIAAVQIEVTGELPSLEALKRTIAEAEAQIAALGNVNLRALEDYEAQQTRHGELSAEFRQLEVQRTDLVNMVAELNGKKKEGLLKVFAAINENFKRMYADLSEGGEAELVLENEQDPLLGGLVMKAKPPHKKVLRLEALSGGEKSLVSMAFIFAIQQYDPSPFYMLDEVDQNLDAVNAEKVARMIGRNAHTAQFVQISLRKVTLKEADHIVGVTMRSDSISELVMKVNLADVHDEKATEEVPA